jgi:hypothetical protein
MCDIKQLIISINDEDSLLVSDSKWNRYCGEMRTAYKILVTNYKEKR